MTQISIQTPTVLTASLIQVSVQTPAVLTAVPHTSLGADTDCRDSSPIQTPVAITDSSNRLLHFSESSFDVL